MLLNQAANPGLNSAEWNSPDDTQARTHTHTEAGSIYLHHRMIWHVGIYKLTRLVLINTENPRQRFKVLETDSTMWHVECLSGQAGREKLEK